VKHFATGNDTSEARPPDLFLMIGAGQSLKWLAVVCTLFGLSLIRPLFGESVHVFYEIGVLGILAVGMLGPSFVKARSLALKNILERFTRDEPGFRKMYQEFVDSQEHGPRPILAGMAAAAFFLAFRITVSWSFIPYTFETTRLVITMLGAVAVGLFVKTIWLLLTFGFLVSRMSLEFEKLQDKLFSWELLERAGTGYARTAFGASFASVGIFWMVLASRGLIGERPESLAVSLSTMFLLLLLALVIPLAYLLVPIWRLHRILVHRKTEIRKLFETDFIRTEREFLEKPRREMAQKYLAERQAVEEVEKLPEWPFRLETFAKVMTLVAIPVVLFFLKEVMADVIVALLKQK